MKLFKKAIGIIAMSLVAGNIPGIMASELSQGSVGNQMINTASMSQRDRVDIKFDNEAPKVKEIWTEVRDSKIYLMISLSDTSSVVMVKVDGHSANLYSGNRFEGVYSYQITSSGTYDIYFEDMLGNSDNTSKAVQLNDEKPTLNLSQTYEDGRYYIVIKASDDGKIDRVTVNDTEISFDENGETKKYQVKKSGNYTVVVRDNMGNETKDSWYINIDDENPTLNLSQTYEDGRYYLVIKASDDGEIDKVTVNGTKISFDKNGETKKYQIKESGKYTVVVRDDAGNETKDSYYIDIDDQKPTLNLSQTYEDGKYYLVIKASDDGKIDRVTVNGAEISFDKNGETKEYRVKESGRYTVVVRDNAGNETKDSYYINIDDEKPTLDLSQTYENGRYYLVIKASDDGKIDRVTVNDTKISFDKNGETKKYQVRESGRYTVVVRDDTGNETKDSCYIDVDARKPELKLSKEYKNNKWYLIIKVNPTNNNRLSKVTVNNRSVSFNSRGDEISYQVSSTDTYKVVVTDDLGMQTSDSLKINVKDKTDTQKPTLNLSQSTIGSSRYYLVIKYSDNEKVTKIEVNGDSIAIPSDGSTILYEVTPGRYTVWASDEAGNEIQQSINIISNYDPNDYNVPSTGTQVVKFRMYHTDWTINGIQQAQMDTPPMNRNGRIYLPLRFTAYALGIDSGQITWDGRTQTATIYDGYDVIKVTVGSRTMSVNGSSMRMEAVAICENNRVLLPISQVSKAFASKGVTLNWDNTAKEITIMRR